MLKCITNLSECKLKKAHQGKMAHKLPTIYFSTLRNNPLGCMSISEEGIIRRDEIAFKNALCTLWEAPSHQEG